MMKKKCVDQRFDLGFKLGRVDYKRAAEVRKQRRLAQIEGREPNEDQIEISLIHITFPQSAHVIKAENELESLRKEFIGTTINYLERFKEEDHKEDPKGRENPLKLLSQLTIGTL